MMSHGLPSPPLWGCFSSFTIMDIFVVVIVPVDMESYNTKMEGPLGDENEVDGDGLGGGGKNGW